MTPTPAAATCIICAADAPVTGVLCERCQAQLATGESLAPEQLVHSVTVPTDAALIDRWGAVHRLGAVTTVGRVVVGDTIEILTPTVSRQHAQITRDQERGWIVRDLDSANGTFVNDVRVDDELALPTRARLRVGTVDLYFIEHVPMTLPSVSRASSKTIRPPSESEMTRFTQNIDTPAPDDEIDLEFEEPTGGGGAVMLVGGKAVQLTLAQYELVKMLVERMDAERDQDPSNRGFMTSDELLVRLSLDSSDAAANNVRQLVRRIRRVLAKHGVADLIESRHNFGYRLIGLPKR